MKKCTHVIGLKKVPALRMVTRGYAQCELCKKYMKAAPLSYYVDKQEQQRQVGKVGRLSVNSFRIGGQSWNTSKGRSRNS